MKKVKKIGPSSFPVLFLGSTTATSVPIKTESNGSDKAFICYNEDKCNHKDCEFHEARPVPDSRIIFNHRGLDYFIIRCPYRWNNFKCYEVFGIHIIRKYNLDKYSRSIESRMKNLEAKIERMREMRERLSEMRRKHNVI